MFRITGTRQVNLQGRINGHHVVILRNDVGIVNIIDRPAENRWVIVKVFVHFLLPHGKSENRPALVQCFRWFVTTPFGLNRPVRDSTLQYGSLGHCDL